MNLRFFLLFSVFLAGCGESVVSNRIRIDIDALSSHKARNNTTGTTSNPSTGAAAASTTVPPSDISGFACYFVSLKGSGTTNAANSSIGTAASNCLGLSLTSDVVTKATLSTSGVSMRFPRPSTALELKVYGISGVAATQCASAFSQTTAPQVYLVATGSVPVPTGDITVVVNSVYDPTNTTTPVVDAYQQSCTQGTLLKLSPQVYFSRPSGENTTPAHSKNSPYLDQTQPLTPNGTGSYSQQVTENFSTASSPLAIDLVFDVTSIDASSIKKFVVSGATSTSCANVNYCGAMDSVHVTAYNSSANNLFPCTLPTSANTTFQCTANVSAAASVSVFSRIFGIVGTATAPASSRNILQVTL